MLNFRESRMHRQIMELQQPPLGERTLALDRILDEIQLALDHCSETFETCISILQFSATLGSSSFA